MLVCVARIIVTGVRDICNLDLYYLVRHRINLVTFIVRYLLCVETIRFKEFLYHYVYCSYINLNFN